MLCVPRETCDFDGVITDQVLNDLSPQLEMLRVPLLPCVNRAAGNVVDVCCRDPNYVDPWPNMNGMNGMKKMNGNNGNNNNQGFQNQPNIQNNQRKNQNNIQGNNVNNKNKNGYGR